MARQWQGCSACGEKTYWIVKDNGVKCTKCQTTISGKGPFKWYWEGCSNCGCKTYWVNDEDGFEACTKCGTGG